jgi:hypothetical protein
MEWICINDFYLFSLPLLRLPQPSQSDMWNFFAVVSRGGLEKGEFHLDEERASDIAGIFVEWGKLSWSWNSFFIALSTPKSFSPLRNLFLEREFRASSIRLSRLPSITLRLTVRK